MSDTEYKRIFQLAKDRALSGFGTLGQCMMKDADESIMQALAQTKSMTVEKSLSSARKVLRQDGNLLLKRVEELYRNYLERAMQTMYTDLRPDITSLTASDLSLIDDDTVNRQIEVDRLARRMRDADVENIGRLNVIIAQMHGQRDARERENPFRPYLIARALHEAVTEAAAADAVARELFVHLSNALIRHLPSYYTAVRAAFESKGLRAQFTAQPSRMIQGQRYFGAVDMSPDIGIGLQPFSARAMSGMQQLLGLLHRLPAAADSAIVPLPPGSETPAADPQDIIRRIFVPASRNAPPPEDAASAAQPPAQDNMLAPASSTLISQLNQYQSLAADGKAIDARLSPEHNQLFAVGAQIETRTAANSERVVINVVAMLFEFLLADDKIPANLRIQLGRLQIPFLKAALLEPGLLQHAEHPARRLLNRMSSVAVGCDAAMPFGQKAENEITRIVTQILARFDTDARIFSYALDGFERFLAAHLRNDEHRTALYVQALEEAEKVAMLAAGTSRALVDILSPLQVEQRISDFIIHIWTRVLVQAFLSEPTSGPAPGTPGAYREHLELLPVLIWSIQEKNTQQERVALTRLLPDLVRRLKAGMALIRLPEEEARQALDILVELHTQVLRSGQIADPRKLPALDELRGRFDLLTMERAGLDWSHGEEVEISPAIIESALRIKSLSATMHLDGETLLPAEERAQFLDEMKPGICLKESASGGIDLVSRLIWVSPHKTLYLCKHNRQAEPVVYTSASLLQSMIEGKLRPVEYAPIFERAVESLIAGAQTLQSQR